MRVEGKSVVVTGGASGIGRAMARRFAAEGARGVVVADLDAAGAAAVAEEIGGLWLSCDVSDPVQVVDLVDRAESEFGPVDLFCANAGIGGGAGLDTPEDMWDLAFDVNVRSHVTAARRLVPGWVERGEGYFLSTASAAGLLTQIGSAPYAVTKHAAVAFAEWLSITYGDAGVKVSCLCPMGVRTKLFDEGLASGAGLGLQIVKDSGRMLEAEEVAAQVIEGLAEERFLILPHPEVKTFVEQRAADPERWMHGMRRLQAQYV